MLCLNVRIVKHNLLQTQLPLPATDSLQVTSSQRAAVEVRGGRGNAKIVKYELMAEMAILQL